MDALGFELLVERSFEEAIEEVEKRGVNFVGVSIERLLRDSETCRGKGRGGES